MRKCLITMMNGTAASLYLGAGAVLVMMPIRDLKEICNL